MHKDFHLYGTYLAARLAGKQEKIAGIIAYAAQAVDDFTYGEYASCQEFRKVATTDTDRLKYYWSIFHFLPSEADSMLVDARKCITAPRGALFDMLSDKIMEATVREECRFYDLMGAAAHVIADTYAHQGFSGIPSKLNIASHLRMCNVMGLSGPFSENSHVPVLAAKLSDKAKIGHGTAGNAPDISWITFTYNNEDHSKVPVERDNAVIFADAFVKLYELFRGPVPLENKKAEIRKRNEMWELVCADLRSRRSALGDKLAEEETYYISRDNMFRDMLTDGTLSEFGAYDGTAEEEALTAGYPAYLKEINDLAKAFDGAPKKEKPEKFRELSDNFFFKAAYDIREAVMVMTDSGFRLNNNADPQNTNG